jgi:hypothetical protein
VVEGEEKETKEERKRNYKEAGIGEKRNEWNLCSFSFRTLNSRDSRQLSSHFKKSLVTPLVRANIAEEFSCKSCRNAKV